MRSPLAFKFGQQVYGDPGLGGLNENGEVSGRDFWLDGDRGLLAVRD